MIQLAPETVRAFEARMARHEIPPGERSAWLRWIRYYLDFCQKYRLPPKSEESIPPFLAKLAQKRQGESQREQAARAIHLPSETERQVTAANVIGPGGRLRLARAASEGQTGWSGVLAGGRQPNETGSQARPQLGKGV